MSEAESAWWLGDVMRALERVGMSDATDVEWTRPGFRLKIRRRPGARLGLRAARDPKDVGVAEGAEWVVAPLTGVFYRAASPDGPPYVVEGDLVQPDTVVGLIETMKIFNEVAAERRGRVGSIVAHAGHVVQVGDPLMAVHETATPPAQAEP